MFERTRLKLLNLVEVLDIPDRVERMVRDMAELRDAYAQVAGAVDEAVGELTTLAARVAELESGGEEARSVASDMRSLADRLRGAYTPPADVPAEDVPPAE